MRGMPQQARRRPLKWVWEKGECEVGVIGVNGGAGVGWSLFLIGLPPLCYLPHFSPHFQAWAPSDPKGPLASL